MALEECDLVQVTERHLPDHIPEVLMEKRIHHHAEGRTGRRQTGGRTKKGGMRFFQVKHDVVQT